MARVYDLVMTHKLDADDYFLHRVQEACAAQGLNFFLIEPLWAPAFLAALERGEVWSRVLLNLNSEHHDPTELYHRLVRLAHERGVRVIDPPDVALASFNKARVHDRLAAAGLQLPPTIIVPVAEVATLQLTAEQKELLGEPFVVKPAMGYGRRGVILDARSERDVARSSVMWPDQHYLLQRRIEMRRFGAEPAYFRVYFVFGKVWSCWWNPYTDRYRVLSEVELLALGLEELEATVRKIATVTGMQFFSSEVAVTEEGRFVVIDYVNDQCHLLTQSVSPSNGVPDELVAAIASRLVAASAEMVRSRA